MKFRLDRRFVLRPFGWHMIHAGIAVIVTFIALAFEWRFVAIAIGAFAVLSIVMAVRMVVFKPPVVMTLTDTGYRASWRAGGKNCRGTWAGLNKVRLSPDSQYLVFEVVGQEEQIFWLALVGDQSTVLQSEIHHRLNNAHGYRPLS